MSDRHHSGPGQPREPRARASDEGELHTDWQVHSAFLRRLARRLLLDAGLADDALQEAWLTVHATGSGASVPEAARRSFFGRIVHNTARTLMRAESRRGRREQSASRAESVPGAADVVARLEVTERVVAIVRALDEPYRTTLLLRFFDDLPPREIAARTGTPVNTVRTQVRRGLERVRAALVPETEAGADAGKRGNELLGLLLPLTGPLAPFVPALPVSSDAPASSGLSGASGTGLLSTAVLMSTSTKLVPIVLGTLLVAAASFATWRMTADGGREPSQDTNPAVLDVAAAPMPVRPDQAVAEAAPAILAADETAPERVSQVAAVEVNENAFVCSGTVTILEQPARGFEIVARLWDGYEQKGEPDVSATLRTDEQGKFRWALPLRPSAACVSFHNEREGTYSYPAEQRVLRDQEPAPFELELYPLDNLIVGKVENEDGEPLTGATVDGSCATVVSDDEGHFELPTTSAFRRAYVNVCAPGHARKREIVESGESGTQVEVVLVLRPEFRVEGQVNDRWGQPIAGASVTSFYGGKGGATTDASGRYRLEHLDPGRPQHSLSASLEGFVLQTHSVETLAAGHATQDFVLDRGVRVSGRVVDPSGAPLPGASLYIGFSPNAYNRLDAVSVDDGSFVFEAVQRGEENLVVQVPGFAPHQRTITMAAGADSLSGVVIVMETGHFVAGHVFDANSDPIAGVWVSVRYKGEYVEGRVETDAEGHFRLEGLPAADLTLEFYSGGIVRQSHPVPRVDVDDVEVTLVRAGKLAGRVVDGVTGAPIHDFKIRFVEPELADGDERLGGVSATWVREGVAFQDEQGLWNTGSESLRPGTVTGIEARAAGYSPSVNRRVVVALEPDPGAVLLRLFRGASIVGQVHDLAAGTPIAGAVVKLYAGHERVSVMDSDDTHGRSIARTDAAGRFRIDHVGSGEHRLYVDHDDYTGVIDGPFDVPESGQVERSVAIGHGGTLSGRLLGADDQPRAGVPVRLDGSTTWRNREAVSGADGGFRFEKLPPGDYRLSPRLALGSVNIGEFTRVVTLEQDESREVELRPLGSATVQGTLQFEDERGQALTVSLLAVAPDGQAAPEVPRMARGTLAIDGVFEIEGVEAGLYRVMAQTYQFQTQRMWSNTEQVLIDVEEGETVDVVVPVRLADMR